MIWPFERQRIETDRLILRPFVAADVPVVQRYCGLWEVASMLTRVPHPYPEGAAAEWIENHHAAGKQGQEHTFAIALKNEDGPGSDPAVGAVSLRNSEPGNFELGYWLAPGCWGCGLATETACAMVRHGFETLGAEALNSGHFADNPASGRVIEKAGFAANGIARQWSEARREYVDCHRFLLTRETWEKAQEEARRTTDEMTS